jgi:antirestriction protein ArdC
LVDARDPALLAGLAHILGYRRKGAYAREKLVAELGAAFLCAELGVVPTVRDADYLGAWLEILKGDNRAIFQAASLASKAAEFVMGRQAAASS